MGDNPFDINEGFLRKLIKREHLKYMLKYSIENRLTKSHFVRSKILNQ